MSRADRLLTLLQVLRCYRKPVSGQLLAEKLQCSLRTIYRDIATLQSQGVHIIGEAGIGYQLRNNATLPPLMFTVEELHALTLGGQWVMEQVDPEFKEIMRNALAKIASVLPAEHKLQMENSGFLLATSPSENIQFLPEIRQALQQQNKIIIEYHDAQNKYSERCLWPIAIGFFTSVRLLVAWCELRNEFRSFRTDRIISFKLLDEKYRIPRQRLLQQWKAQQEDDCEFHSFYND